jgi:hypothetical protein
MRDCWFGGGLRNNNVGWIGNLVIDRCHIGMDTPQTSGIEALQCGAGSSCVIRRCDS